MKIAGKALGKRSTEVVRFVRGNEQFCFTVQALPLGFLEGALLERLPLLVPKREYAMKNGKVLRDENHRPVEVDAVEDPAFMAADRKRKILISVAGIYEGLKVDPTITWDSQPDKFPKDWPGFYQAIYTELVESGMTTGEMNQLSTQILDLSMNKQSDLESIRESFLSGVQPQPAGSLGESRSTQDDPKAT